ncbi:hypothetical protein QRQ56_37940 [Bradyrhizobium sp. U531]|uniref:hypothetical protein n=1 Tax=Bradyrhizobium sp. U531 TaxID=3053458 RepID=UPI003F425B44
MMSFSRFAAVLAMVVALAGCGRSESYRYKLTLVVNTPDGVRRGSTVTEWVYWEVSIPARGTPHKLRGEALYLDLGPGARPLIALLTSHLHPKGGMTYWDWGAGYLLSRLYGLSTEFGTDAAFMDHIARLGRMRGLRRISPADLPDLVTFADINDPRSVIEIDPNNLQATVGPNITWNEITLEMTDEPITTGIEKKLPWIPQYFEKNLRLDGTDHGAKRDIANQLSWADFDQSGALKRH